LIPATPTALLADDEPLLLQSLERALATAWPDLQVVARCHEGQQALAEALKYRPTVCFLDVRMPGLSGLEVATALADDWPVTAGPFPLVVFVTAYDQYALAAFEAQAADYVLKPLDPRRVGQCVSRLQARLAERVARAVPPDEAALMAVVQGLAQLQQRVGAPSGAPVTPPAATPTPAPPLRYLQASQGATLHVVPLADVLVIEAADRYLRLLTADAEHLIRTPLRELQAQLPEDDFWQIHRSVLVRASAIARVHRDDAGKLTLSLRQRPETWTVSRMHAARFRAM